MKYFQNLWECKRHVKDGEKKAYQMNKFHIKEEKI